MFPWKVFIIIATFIQKRNSYILKESDVDMKDDLQRVVQTFMNPIKKLSDVLPNHAIELQVEYVNSHPINLVRSPTQNSEKRHRFFKLHNKPYPYYYGKDPHYRPAGRSKDKATSVNGADASKAAASTTTIATQATTTESPDPKKRPVNLEDLEKALSEFEKRLMSNQLFSDTSTTSSNALGSQVSSSDPQTHSLVIQDAFGGSPNQNIDDIMQLLKKGIQVERNVPRPTDENLDWLEVRIPK